jgi:hypothetical protein
MKLTSRLALVLTLAAIAAPVYAGAKLVYTVVVDLTNRRAYGNLGAARNSADATQHLECGIATTAPNSMFCQATDAAGSSVYCYSSDSSLIAATANISGDSYAYFTWDTSGKCTYLFTENGSRWEPKK